MSNQHNEKEFEKIMQEVEQLDQEGMLEILFFIAENLYEHGVVE
jgi:hypothetical protein